MASENGRDLLIAFNEKQFDTFLTTPDTVLRLPVPSRFPGRVLSANRISHYEKIDCSPSKDQTLTLVKKNKHPHGFVWRTDHTKLKQAIHFGIITPPSLVGSVIATVGKYRLAVHGRIAKGLSTHTQSLKLKLLDHYQDRLETLSDLESMVNSSLPVNVFTERLSAYIEKLKALQAVPLPELLDEIIPGARALCKKDLDAAIERAKIYQKNIQDPAIYKAAHRARGEDSMHEFVKREALQSLYELQGLNQDITYSKARRFALTRGDLNDHIEDARKVIDDHRADPRNSVTPAHHYQYAPGDKLSFYFSPDRYTPDEEREALLGLSFIEGWDRVHDQKTPPTVQNEQNVQETLQFFYATNWAAHRTWKAALKNIAYFIYNTLKSFIFDTHPWEEEAWPNEQFHLYATKLRSMSRPNVPLVKKLFHFVREIVQAVQDFFGGMRDVAKEMVIRLPAILQNDWRSTQAYEINLLSMYTALNPAIKQLYEQQKDQIDTLFRQSGLKTPPQLKEPDTQPIYNAYTPLTPGEQNDILTAMVRGADTFLSVFTHPIYAKDPVAGVIFTFIYLSGGAVVMMPDLAKALFGKGYADWFTSFSKTMGSTPMSMTIAGASSEAQLCAFAWDFALTGPKSNAIAGLKTILSDPLKSSLVFGLAYGTGYLLAHGIDGHGIPGITEALREELGTIPELAYPVTGAKVLVSLFELLDVPLTKPFEDIKKEFIKLDAEMPAATKASLQKIEFVFWLSTHAAQLSKLDRALKFKLEQHIDHFFKPSEAKTFKTLLNPPQSKSIAHQLLFIPLSYIPAILRCVSSVGMSLLALIRNRTQPLAPMQRAFGDLAGKVAYDLTRLLIFASELTRMIGKGIGAVFKAFAFTFNFMIGRVAGLFQMTLGHHMHVAFGTLHRGITWIREWLYPSRLTRHLGTAHPRHVTATFEREHQTTLHSFEQTSKTPPPPPASTPSPLHPIQAEDKTHVDHTADPKVG